MTVGLVVGVLTLAASAPWWCSDRAARRRARRLAAGSCEAVSRPADAGPSCDVPVLLELVVAAVRSGAGVPRALRATGDAVGGADGAALTRAADALRLGANWDAAWDGAPDRLEPVHRALRGAWVDGAPPTEALRAAAAEHAHERRAAARTAAARLAVRLVLPLGACFLPAFVLVGLVPVLLALGVDLLST